MLIHIDPNRGVPYYRQVKEQVTQMILTGQLKPGEQLESVSQLSRRLKVNPMTISKAYSFLVEEKLVERRPGIGIFVNDMDRSKKKELAEDKLTSLLNQSARLCF